MSRRMPPTPVAAPWNGSTADGWLWLSTLNATASPSPRSTTPAFSPGPWSTRGESVGKRRSSGAECLYAQCSDQRSEKTASSKWFGSRSSSSWIRSNSPSVRPRARWSGCSATRVRDSSLAMGRDGSRIVDRPMRIIRGSSEAEVVAAFLRGELDSPRYGERIRELLPAAGLDESALLAPELEDAEANTLRARVLEEHRAWLRREGLFNGFPDDVDWSLVGLAPEEVLSILYIDWDWWLDIS